MVEENGVQYDALIICSFGVNDNYVLVNNPDYPSIAADYVATYAKARALPVDVFLGSHGFFYGLAEKYAKLQGRRPGEPNPFVDRAGYLAHIALKEQRLKTMLEAQQRAAR
jgi:metallo-beta-lactamase class B